jgi:hypothetical protein
MNCDEEFLKCYSECLEYGFHQGSVYEKPNLGYNVLVINNQKIFLLNYLLYDLTGQTL